MSSCGGGGRAGSPDTAGSPGAASPAARGVGAGQVSAAHMSKPQHDRRPPLRYRITALPHHCATASLPAVRSSIRSSVRGGRRELGPDPGVLGG